MPIRIRQLRPTGIPLAKAENDFLYQPPPETPASPAPSNISRPQQPSPATLNPTDPFPAVPQELKEQRQWVNWVETERNGKPTKIPIQLPRHQDGKILAKGAKSETPSTWRTYQQVLQTHNRYKNVTIYTWKRDDTSENPNWVTVHGEYGGIGVVFSPSDPYCGESTSTIVSIATTISKHGLNRSLNA